MQKGIDKIKIQEEIEQKEKVDMFPSYDNIIFNKLYDNSIKNERKKIYNKYIYFTPIQNEKLSCYIPSTPKKLKNNKVDEESFVIGKNLLYIFESM